MLLKLRQRLAQEESGFTLIELLVVMLILGILAAIAIPAFLSQSQKGEDSKAIADIRTAETTLETYATQNRGVYTNDQTALVGVEPAMTDVFNDSGFSITLTDSNTGYVVTDNGAPGHTFTLTRAANGGKTRTCGPSGEGACDGTGHW